MGFVLLADNSLPFWCCKPFINAFFFVDLRFMGSEPQCYQGNQEHVTDEECSGWLFGVHINKTQNHRALCSGLHKPWGL